MSICARLVASAVVVCGLFASPAENGRAEGTITVNGQTTRLAYAYARAVKGFFDKTKEDIEVVLSDVPLDGKALEDQFERMRLADSGKLHAFEITIDSEGAPISTSWRHNGFTRVSPSGLSSADAFTRKVFDGRTVDGHYASAKPHEFFGNTYSFDVAFRANITRPLPPIPPTPAQIAAARQCPQAKVYLDYLRAVQAEDLGALRKLFAKEQAKNLDAPDAKQMLKLLKMMAATEIQLLKVDEKIDRADLTVSGRQDGDTVTGVIHLVREGGSWRIQGEEWKN